MKLLLDLLSKHPLLFLLLFLAPHADAQDVLTQHNDLNRTGWNSHETILNHRNVQQESFGKIFTRSVDDQIYAQPLVMMNVSIPGIGKRNIVFVATVNNSVYAFDADSANRAGPFWKVNLTAAHSRPPGNTDMTGACNGNYKDFSGKIGIVGTPVIDNSTNTLFVVARSLDTSNNTFLQYLHALDITTGAERTNSPRLITARVKGRGIGNQNGVIYFDAQKQNQRCGLLLLNNTIYIAYASHCDWGPYHGWLLGYDKNTLEQTRVYNTTPEGNYGGIWMSASAPAADDSGNIYVAVGNGTVGIKGYPVDISNRGESALKLTPVDSAFVVASFFTPSDFTNLNVNDLDFGVTQMLLIPGTHLALTGCKNGKLFLMNRDSMGGYHSDSNDVLQEMNVGSKASLHSTFAFYKGAQKDFVYMWSENSTLKALPYNRTQGLFVLANVINGHSEIEGEHGAFLSGSSNGTTDSTAILWVSHSINGDPSNQIRHGILRAFDATDVTKELWNSSLDATDNPGNFAKFNCPVVANGKVYLATFSNQLVVYGLRKKIKAVNDPLLYPNPASTTTYLLKGNVPVKAINIYTIDGKLITRINGASNPVVISVNHFMNGIYVIEIRTTDNAVFRRKLVVQH